jgi:hypothetical protein
MTIRVEKDLVLVPAGGTVVHHEQYGIRWHGVDPSSRRHEGQVTWYSEDFARRAADRYRQSETSDDDTEWAELVRRDVVTVYGPVETVST